MCVQLDITSEPNVRTDNAERTNTNAFFEDCARFDNSGWVNGRPDVVGRRRYLR